MSPFSQHESPHESGPSGRGPWFGVAMALALLLIAAGVVAVASSVRSGTAVGSPTTTSAAGLPPTTVPSTDGTPTTTQQPGTDTSGAAFTVCAGIPAAFPIGPRGCTIVSPPDVKPDERLPVVVLFHGLSEPPYTIIAEGSWPAAVVAHRFMVVAPAGVLLSWNAGGCCAPAQTARIDDVGFIDKLLDQIGARPDVDMDRLFMVGGSNGGMMVSKYLCTGTHRVAAAVSVAGTSVAGCQPASPTRFLHIHGLSDRTVPYQGGTSLISAVLGVSFEPVTSSLTALAAAEGCAATPSDTSAGAVTTRTWSGCTNEATVRLVSVAGLDHIWPIAPLYDATGQILRFFAIT